MSGGDDDSATDPEQSGDRGSGPGDEERDAGSPADAPPAADADADSAPPTDGADPGPPSGASPTDDADAAEGWQAALAAAGELTGDAVEALIAVHGSRGRRAIEAVSEERVKRYRDFTVVVGHADEYVVEDGTCTCKDSEYNLDPDDPSQRCWHALAVAVADRIGAVDHHDMWYSDVREFV